LTSSSEDYETRHPEPADVALIIEVADSSLRQDRDLMPIYGGGVVPTSWIVNLSDREVEVYSHPFQAGYRSRQVFDASQEVPLVIDGSEIGRIAVADILPQRVIVPHAHVIMRRRIHSEWPSALEFNFALIQRMVGQ
jgi:hypothetical protein